MQLHDSLSELKLVSCSNPSPEITLLILPAVRLFRELSQLMIFKKTKGTISTWCNSPNWPIQKASCPAMPMQRKRLGCAAGVRLSSTAVSLTRRSFCCGSASHSENTQADTQLCSWAHWFLRECYVFSCAFVKTPLRDKVFSLQKTNCSGINSNDDFHDVKVIQNFYSKLETQSWGNFK